MKFGYFNIDLSRGSCDCKLNFLLDLDGCEPRFEVWFANKRLSVLGDPPFSNWGCTDGFVKAVTFLMLRNPNLL
jgi:hypothetical protein